MLLKRFIAWLLPERAKIIPSPNLRVGGAFFSQEDERDYNVNLPSLTVPEYFILSWLSGEVETQGAYQSCVAHAITGAIETYARVKNWRESFELSRMHLWNESRKLTWGDDWTYNRGVYVRDGWKAAKKGITLEKLFPYQPSYEEYELHHSLIFKWYPDFSYYWLRETGNELVEAIKKVLYFHRGDVVFSILVPKSFFNPDKKKVYNPSSREKGLFAHAMRIIGYDNARKAFLIRNSWGKSWGDKGSLWVSQSWIGRAARDASFVGEVTT